jgi:sugar O-acyltransferase (sialic acid O-acetyltransferase NeuD family)
MKIGIVGTGGFAREILAIIDELGKFNDIIAFFEPDDIFEKKFKDVQIMGKPVLPFSEFNHKNTLMTLAMANSKIRELTTKQLPTETEFISLIHPTANVSKWVNLGRGSIITAGCIVTTHIEIGDFCQLNWNTTIGHDCKIKDFFTTAPAANISGNCEIGNQVYVGTGAAVKQGITICDDVIIGMGAMVVKNITESGTYIGIPATKIK